MKIAMVTNGRTQIPDKNMGSIENIVWNYKYYLEKKGHTVNIYNSAWIQDTIYQLNTISYDFIHVHFELFVLELNKHMNKKYMLTCHSGALSKFIPGNFDYYPGFNYSFSDILDAPGNFALSEKIKELYLSSGYNKFLRVLPNAVETEKFVKRKKGNGKAICIGRIQPRKQQKMLTQLLQDDIEIDFIGPSDRESEYGIQNFKPKNKARYLGSWTRDEVYENLSKYSCLINFSKSEAHPLVVLEAMAAGLSIVATEASTDNLSDEKFITPIDSTCTSKDTLIHAVKEAIDNNAIQREEIIKYVFKNFDYSIITKNYIEIAKEFIKYTTS